MANRRWTSNPDRKISDAAGMTIPKAGSRKSISPIKTAAWPGLPGPSNQWYKVKGQVVKQHPAAKGIKGY